MNERSSLRTVAAATAMLCAAAWPAAILAAKPPRVTTPVAQGSFTDHLDAQDAVRWSMADGWKNGSPFANAWKADHVSFAAGQLELKLDDLVHLGMPYTSGEYRSTGYYGYGCYEASFRPVKRAGVITSFFTFAGPYDNGGNGRHNEIDVEFVGDFEGTRNGQRDWWVQFNFWTNDDSYASRNEYRHWLGFDPAAQPHVYAFHWHEQGIDWYVDGNLVYGVESTQAVPTPRASESLQKIMMNLWPVDATAEGWAGRFEYPGQPLVAGYDWVRYTKGASCAGLVPPELPSPPAGSETDLSVRDIALSLDARATQAIARVSIVDGLGQPLGGVAVTGQWSGGVSGGDTSRTTDAAGVATFYSARSRNLASATFCVTGATRSGYVYRGDANVETCESVSRP